GELLEQLRKSLKAGGKVWKFKGVAEVDGELACEAEFTAMMDLPK
ncbi:MAG: 3-hydroxyacyl-ACP dehydratase FabZ, partial [Rhodobacterales bacterium]